MAELHDYSGRMSERSKLLFLLGFESATLDLTGKAEQDKLNQSEAGGFLMINSQLLRRLNWRRKEG